MNKISCGPELGAFRQQSVLVQESGVASVTSEKDTAKGQSPWNAQMPGGD